MRRFHILPLLLVACFATATLAQTPAPKPDPEMKKLAVLVGHWTYEGEYKPGPLGPGGKVTGTETDQEILAGFFLEGRQTEKGAMGETHTLDLYGYDPVNKNFTFSAFTDDGSSYSGVMTISETTWTWSGKMTTAGGEVLFRGTNILAADGMSFTQKMEVSSGGKTWMPVYESKWTKAKPAPKK
jgi:hypothetical protein